MIKLSRYNCTGCSVCAQSCPKKCITMEPDIEGFLIPTVHKGCVECHLCEKVCPELNMKQESEFSLRTFIGYNSNEKIRSISSSGGVFSLLAERILQEGGVVFGAAFDKEFNVIHQIVEGEDTAERFYGSKYVQSTIGTTYIDAERYLKENRIVLFSGTPCQIRGLKNFLREPYDNLIAIDVLCHVVVSSEIWQAYLNEKAHEYGSAVKQISFRQKDDGWKKFALKICFENMQEYVKEHHNDTYMQFFLNNVALRQSCYRCSAKKDGSCADLTIGDAWGIEKYAPEMNDDKGTSLIIVRSEKGLNLLSGIKAKMIVQEGKPEDLLESHPEISIPCNPAAMRPSFYRKLKKGYSIREMKRLTSRPTKVERLQNRIYRVIDNYKQRCK